LSRGPAVFFQPTGTTTFVSGPWQPGYAVGAYGVDPTTTTVWAVLNYDGDFAIGQVRNTNHRHQAIADPRFSPRGGAIRPSLFCPRGTRQAAG